MSSRPELRAPFPWFGGKSRVAEIVWRAFGDPPNYVEPFAGSLAVLLGRDMQGPRIETVNDRDCYLSNFWRAVHANPEAVAEWCDWPVNEADLHARHLWLVSELETHRARMHSDADYYDEKIAGWWVWGLCQWIGGGWCAEPNNQKHPKLDGIGKGTHSNAGFGLKQQLPKLSVTDGAAGIGGVHARVERGAPQPHWQKRPDLHDSGKGVHSDRAHRPHHVGVNSSQRPHLDGTSSGMGIHGRRPNLSGAGDGVHRRRSFWNERLYLDRRPDLSNAHGVHLPSLGNDRGINGVAAAPCTEWFLALCERLRRVRVACGDWRRVLGPSVLGKGKNVGGRRPCAVFLDPPYSHEFRDPFLYSEDDAAISVQVREWALEHGDDPELRIALCGYEGEHELPGWTKYAWKAARGYASEDNENRELERIWFSPHCLPIEDAQLGLFDGSVAG